MENRQTEEAIADLKRAVYERFGSPSDLRRQVQSRATAIQAVLEASQNPSGDQPHFTDEFVRHWVSADITAFRRVPAEERQRVAAGIAVSMKHPAYAKKLIAIDSQLARRVSEAAIPADWLADPASIKDTSPRVEGLTPRASLDDEQRPSAPVARPRPGQTQSQSVNGFLGSVPAPEATPNPVSTVNTRPLDPQGDIQKLLATVTYETQVDGTVKYSVRAKPSFIDHGNQILMIAKANEDEESILAGLLLASEKYGGAFEITGSEEFKRRAIEILVKYQLHPKLKDPAQDAVFRELSKQGDAQSSQSSVPSGTPSTAPERGPAPKPNPAVRDANTPPVAVKAIDWWNTQRELIQSTGQNTGDIEESLRNLGPKPSRNTTWWFQDGRPCPPPPSALSVSAEPRRGFAGSTGDQSSERRMGKEQASQRTRPHRAVS